MKQSQRVFSRSRRKVGVNGVASATGVDYVTQARCVTWALVRRCVNVRCRPAEIFKIAWCLVRIAALHHSALIKSEKGDIDELQTRYDGNIGTGREMGGLYHT